MTARSFAFLLLCCITSTIQGLGYRFLIDRDLIAKKDGFKFNVRNGRGKVRGMGFQSFGCWKDTWDRAIEPLEGKHEFLMDSNYKLREDPLRKCALVALVYHLRMFAIENGGQCLGDRNAARFYQRFGIGDQCRDDGYGGPWSMQVYAFTGYELKPRHGRYTKWSLWTDCSKTCGKGIKKRTRNCTQPSPANGGMNCRRFGPSNQTKSCQNDCSDKDIGSYNTPPQSLSPITETFMMTPKESQKVKSLTNSHQSTSSSSHKDEDDMDDDDDEKDEDDDDDYDDDEGKVEITVSSEDHMKSGKNVAKFNDDKTKSGNITKSNDMTKSSDDITKSGDVITKSNDDMTKSSDDITKAHDDITKAHQGGAKSTKSSDDITKSSDDITKSSDDMTKSSDDITKSSDDMTKSSDDITKAHDDITKFTDGVAKSTDDVTKPANDVVKSTDDVTKSTDDVSKSTDDMTKSTDDVTISTHGAAKSTNDVTKPAEHVAKSTDNLATSTAPVTNDISEIDNGISQFNDKSGNGIKTYTEDSTQANKINPEENTNISDDMKEKLWNNQLKAAHDILRARWLSLDKNRLEASPKQEEHGSSRQAVVEASLTDGDEPSHENDDDEDEEDTDDEKEEEKEEEKDEEKVEEMSARMEETGTKRITEECICPIVMCLHLANTGVLIDNSNVTDIDDLVEMKSFAKGLAAGFGTEKKDIQMGIIAAGRRSKIVVPFGETIPAHDLNRRVDGIRRENGPSALRQAMKRAEAYLLAKQKKAIPPLLNDVVFVMVSGDSDVDVHAPLEDLKKGGAKVVVIGVGKNAKIGKIASQADKMFMVPPGAGNAMVNAIIAAVCKPDLMGKIGPNPKPCPCTAAPSKKRSSPQNSPNPAALGLQTTDPTTAKDDSKVSTEPPPPAIVNQPTQELTKAKGVASPQAAPATMPAASATLPDTPSATLPDTPSATLPDTPSATLPDTPSATMPDTPSATLPDTPSATLPDTPSATLPDTPSATLPDTPSATLPDTPSATLPDTPSATLPDTPSATLPDTPSATMPVTPPATSPATPPATSPATPPATSPATPPATVAAPPATVADSSPATVPATSPATVADSSPATVPPTPPATSPVKSPGSVPATLPANPPVMSQSIANPTKPSNDSPKPKENSGTFNKSIHSTNNKIKPLSKSLFALSESLNKAQSAGELKEGNFSLSSDIRNLLKNIVMLKKEADDLKSSKNQSESKIYVGDESSQSLFSTESTNQSSNTTSISQSASITESTNQSALLTSDIPLNLRISDQTKSRLGEQSASNGKVNNQSKTGTQMISQSKTSTDVISQSKPSTEMISQSKPSTEMVSQSKPSTEMGSQSNPSTEMISQSLPKPKIASQSNIVAPTSTNNMPHHVKLAQPIAPQEPIAPQNLPKNQSESKIYVGDESPSQSLSSTESTNQSSNTTSISQSASITESTNQSALLTGEIPLNLRISDQTKPRLGEQSASNGKVNNQSKTSTPVISQSKTSTEVISQSKPSTEMISQSKPSTAMGSQSNLSTEMGSQSNPSTQMGSQSKPSTEMVSQLKPSTEMGSQSNPSTQMGSQSKPSTEMISQSKPSTEMGSQSNPSTHMRSQSKPSTEVISQSKPSTEMISQSKPSTEMVSQSKPSTEMGSQSKPSTEMISQSKPSTEMVSQSKPSTEMGSQSNPSTEMISQSLPKPKIASQSNIVAPISTNNMPHHVKLAQPIAPQNQKVAQPNSNLKEGTTAQPSGKLQDTKLQQPAQSSTSKNVPLAKPITRVPLAQPISTVKGVPSELPTNSIKVVPLSVSTTTSQDAKLTNTKLQQPAQSSTSKKVPLAKPIARVPLAQPISTVKGVPSKLPTNSIKVVPLSVSTTTSQDAKLTNTKLQQPAQSSTSKKVPLAKPIARVPLAQPISTVKGVPSKLPTNSIKVVPLSVSTTTSQDAKLTKPTTISHDAPVFQLSKNTPPNAKFVKPSGASQDAKLSQPTDTGPDANPTPPKMTTQNAKPSPATRITQNANVSPVSSPSHADAVTHWPGSTVASTTQTKGDFLTIEKKLAKSAATQTATPKSSIPDCDINLGFVLDGSASIEGMKRGNFIKMINFVKDIIHGFVALSRQVHVGTLVYSTGTSVILTFGTKGTEEMIDRLLDNVHYPGQGSRTGNALKDSWNKMFSSVPRGRKSVLLLLTDGPSNDDVKRPSEWIKAQKVEVFVIGLGTSYDEQQLNIMASEPAEKHVMMKQFDELRSSVQEVRNRLCGFNANEILQIINRPGYQNDADISAVQKRFKPNQCILDVAFLLDGSRQVETNGEGNFQRQINFIKKAAKFLPLSRDDVHIGLGLLGDSEVMVFPTNEHYTEDAIDYELDHIRYPASSVIQTRDLISARDIMLQKGIRDVAPHVFVLVTDVSSLDSYRPAIEDMQSDGSDVVMLGIGTFSWKQELKVRSSVEGLVDQVVTIENVDETEAVQKFADNLCKLSNAKRAEIPRRHWKYSQKVLNANP